MKIGQEKQLPKSENPHLEKDRNFKQLREFTIYINKTFLFTSIVSTLIFSFYLPQNF